MTRRDRYTKIRESVNQMAIAIIGNHATPTRLVKTLSPAHVRSPVLRRVKRLPAASTAIDGRALDSLSAIAFATLLIMHGDSRLKAVRASDTCRRIACSVAHHHKNLAPKNKIGEGWFCLVCSSTWCLAALTGGSFLLSIMADSEHLRSQAARLLAMGMKAYENGHIGMADALITRAMEYLEQADCLDRRRGLDVGSEEPGSS